ncbi:MAG: LysM peptidoglycan-binding domain-containing protein [Gaiellaceae bacterium]
MQAREDWRRYVAPAAFLLAVTVAVVLVRSGLEHGGRATGGSTPTVTSPHKTVETSSTRGHTTTTAGGKRYWIVRAGDTFGVISSKTGVPVATIARLNPKASSTSLYIGERIRYR